MIIVVTAAVIHPLMRFAMHASVVSVVVFRCSRLAKAGQFGRCRRTRNEDGRTIISRPNHPSMRNRPLHASGKRCEQKEQPADAARLHGFELYSEES